jgi:hypothetical protein
VWVQQLPGTARPEHGSARYRTEGFCNTNRCHKKGGEGGREDGGMAVIGFEHVECIE